MVLHPSAWPHGGYNEIQTPPQRYALIDREKLIACCGLASDTELREKHRQWVEGSIHGDRNVRQPEWTESIAVGSEGFVQDILENLNTQGRGRRVREAGDHYELREPQATYSGRFGGENGCLTPGNKFYWNESDDKSKD